MRRLLALAMALSCSIGLRAQETQNYASELPRIEPTVASETAASFTIADGFKLQLVASEPLVSTPVAIEWDAEGAMYVCEMRGYSEDRDAGLSRVRRLVDLDDDGVYDRSDIFIDGLLWPTAIFPFDGGLFIGDAPNILYCKDTDGDGVADRKDIVLTGFGVSNVQGLLNSFRWGLDHRIHVACSSAAGKVHRPGQANRAVDVRGRDIAFDPRTFAFELTSGGAQHGMCFDDWGHKFASSNSDHIQQVMYEDRYIARNRFFTPAPARISIAADGPQAEVYRTSPVEPWRIVRTRLRVGGVVSGPIEGGGRASGYFTGATGVTIARGDHVGSLRGNAIVGDVGSNLIHRKRIGTDGLRMIAERIDSESELVASSDIWFRPAQFANAPDGSLHVVDVYREVIEHPKSLPPQIKQHLDLTSGRDRGRIYRLSGKATTPRTGTPNLTKLASTDLVTLLEHPNSWHRETAARLLFERQDQTAALALQKMVSESSSPQGRIHSMYAQHGLRLLDDSTLLRLLSDTHPQVRKHALRLAERSDVSPALNAAFSRLAGDDSIEVRYQFSFSLGEYDHPDKNQLLARVVMRDVTDRWMRTAVQSSVGDGAGELFLRLVQTPDFRSSDAGVFLTSLATQIERRMSAKDAALALRGVDALADDDPIFAIPILAKLSRISRGSTSSSVSTRISKQIDKMLRQAVAEATDAAVPRKRRLSALRSLRYGDWQSVGDPVINLLSDPLTEIRSAAMSTISHFPAAPLAAPLLSRWSEFSPSLRRAALEILFSKPERIETVFLTIQQGDFDWNEVPRDRMEQSLRALPDDLRDMVEVRLEETKPESPTSLLSRYRASLDQSTNDERGFALFRKHCSACHRARNVGNELGPNLATVRTRGAEAILQNVLDPNAEVNPQFINYTILTLDGRTITGMIAEENANSVTLTRAEALSDTVLREDIARMQSTRKSIMPEGLHQSIDPESMNDLIGFLLHVD